MEELDYYWKKVQKITDPEELVKEKRKSVRGCIIGPDISVIALAIVKKGEKRY